MLSEAEYLGLQATRAKARLRQTARTLAHELLAPIEIRPFIRRRPWCSLGGAAIAGFVSGLGLGHGRRKPAVSRAGGKVRYLLAMVSRVRRALGSTLGAMVVASLRSAAPAPGTPSPNGHGAVPPSPTA